MPQLVTGKRDFPGQRRLGATNYGQYKMGRKGYKKRVNGKSINSTIKMPFGRYDYCSPMFEIDLTMIITDLTIIINDLTMIVIDLTTDRR